MKLFSPLSLRQTTIPNRIAISPMSMYSGIKGMPSDFVFPHYAQFALGGAGLIIVEQTAINPEGRITHGCLGIWNDEQARALAPIAQFIRAQGSIPAIQISHAGRKASTQRAWHGSGPLNEQDIARGETPWTPVGPTEQPFAEGWLQPAALSIAQIHELIEQFVQAALRALRAGFEIIELHMAHGYLLQSFLTPLANQRTDEYGGSLDNRMRFPLEVAAAVRQAVGTQVPLLARISATDWIDGGWQMSDSLVLAQSLKECGIDLIDCSSGGNLVSGATNANLRRAPGYQAEFAREIRQKIGIPTQAVGLIRTPELANKLLVDGSADMIAIGRQALFDPFWPRHAAEALGVDLDYERWPEQYGWWLEKWSKGLKSTGQEPNPWKDNA